MTPVFEASSNPLLQELFQCKLTRQGTIAPSDRQSKIRKSLNYIQNSIKNHQPVIGYKPSFIKSRQLNNTATTITTTTTNNNNNSQSDDSSIITSSSSSCVVTSDKSLPLTVACHFKVKTCSLFFLHNTQIKDFLCIQEFITRINWEN